MPLDNVSTVRLFVYARMAPHGASRNALTNEQKKVVWLAGDGLFAGGFTSKLTGEACNWDYDHVVKSSEKAFRRMAALIKGFQILNAENGGPLADGSYTLS